MSGWYHHYIIMIMANIVLSRISARPSCILQRVMGLASSLFISYQNRKLTCSNVKIGHRPRS